MSDFDELGPWGSMSAYILPLTNRKLKQFNAFIHQYKLLPALDKMREEMLEEYCNEIVAKKASISPKKDTKKIGKDFLALIKDLTKDWDTIYNWIKQYTYHACNHDVRIVNKFKELSMVKSARLFGYDYTQMKKGADSIKLLAEISGQRLDKNMFRRLIDEMREEKVNKVAKEHNEQNSSIENLTIVVMRELKKRGDYNQQIAFVYYLFPNYPDGRYPKQFRIPKKKLNDAIKVLTDAEKESRGTAA